MFKTKIKRVKNRKTNTRKQKGGMLRMLGLERQPVPQFAPETYEELKEAVDYYCAHNTYFDMAGKHRYGNINNWDVSRIINMSSLFKNKSTFNENINNWNTMNVTNMSDMFSGAKAFNQPLDNWNTNNVANMQSIFENARTFNQPLDNWNTSNVTNMRRMFSNAEIFNQPLNDWNTINVTNMSEMFSGAKAFNQPINNWNTINVVNMYEMFSRTKTFNQPLNNWNTSNVADMSFMFSFAKAFNQPLNNWNTINVAIMNHMFYNATKFNQPLNEWNIRNVMLLNGMFLGATDYTYGPLIMPQAQPVIPQQGIAYEVHNAFDTINFGLLFETINSDNNVSPSNIFRFTNNTDNATPIDFYNFINNILLNESIFVQTEEETQHLKNNLQAIRNKIINIDFTGSLGNIQKTQFIGSIMKFVETQPNEYIYNYVYSYIKDNIGAYPGDYDNNSIAPNLTTSSCVKGMFERIIINLRSGGMGLNRPKYIKIAKIIGNETIVDDNCETHTIEITDDMLRHFVPKCIDNHKADLIRVSPDKRRDILTLCVLRKLAREGQEVDTIENYDQTVLDSINAYLVQDGVSEMYLDDYYLTGGRRKRKKKNKTQKRKKKI